MSAMLGVPPPVWVDKWWLRVPWTSSLGLPFWRVVASFEDGAVFYTLGWGWSDVDFRIRRIDRSEDGGPEVFYTPTPADPAQVDRWWAEITGPPPDPHIRFLSPSLTANNTGDAQGPVEEPTAPSVRAFGMAVVLGERR